MGARSAGPAACQREEHWPRSRRHLPCRPRECASVPRRGAGPGPASPVLAATAVACPGGAGRSAMARGRGPCARFEADKPCRDHQPQQRTPTTSTAHSFPHYLPATSSYATQMTRNRITRSTQHALVALQMDRRGLLLANEHACTTYLGKHIDTHSTHTTPRTRKCAYTYHHADPQHGRSLCCGLIRWTSKPYPKISPSAAVHNSLERGGRCCGHRAQDWSENSLFAQCHFSGWL